MNCSISLPRIYIALPIMNESATMTSLLSDLKSQSIQPEEVVCCVNQPEKWWDDPIKIQTCHQNQVSINILKAEHSIKITVIDRASSGLGWQGKQSGVGWARKMAMDLIASKASSTDIIVSLDADTAFGPDYLLSIARNLTIHPDATGLSIPYYHKFAGNDELLDRAMLRYEIYMRSYAINLWRIGSPYSFTALGSAIAIPVWAYKAIGGMTPKKSGEDFYMLQKLRKYGHLLYWNDEKVYPGTRLSDRVLFGTGPALIKGVQGDWSSYPIYSASHFDEVKVTYNLFARLFDENLQTPMTYFLESIFGSGFWQPLRKNARTAENFVKSCHQKVDALRILQYLRWRNQQEPGIAEERLIETIALSGKEVKSFELLMELNDFSFETSPISKINRIRDFLMKREETFQHNHADNFNNLENK